jgi:hypothetical protein
MVLPLAAGIIKAMMRRERQMWSKVRQSVDKVAHGLWEQSHEGD